MGYQVYHMNDVKKSVDLPQPIDAFICFYTQEDRAFHALYQLHNKKQLHNIMVISFGTEEYQTPISNCQDQDICLISAKVDNDLSSSVMPCLRAINEYIKDKKNIGVDISCMPIPLMAQVLHFLYSHYRNIPLVVYYTEPLHYNLRNLFDYSAYNGEIDIKTIPGFEGEASRINEVKRVVFYLLGFEMKYLNELIPQDVNPNEIAPINGFPSYFPKYKDISLINNNINFYENDIEIIYSEANNPFQTYNTMIVLKDKYEDFSIDIIPVGTKPMALGACLFALRNGNANCRIIFPFPNSYRPNQNAGCGTLWEYKL